MSSLTVAPEQAWANRLIQGQHVALGGVDFQKGCFVGQENVSRMNGWLYQRARRWPVPSDLNGVLD